MCPEEKVVLQKGKLRFQCQPAVATTVAPVLSMSSQLGRQIEGPHVTSVTGTSGPQGSQSKPSLGGQVFTTLLSVKKT